VAVAVAGEEVDGDAALAEENMVHVVSVFSAFEQDGVSPRVRRIPTEK
jgi:hypothetical protein